MLYLPADDDGSLAPRLREEHSAGGDPSQASLVRSHVDMEVRVVYVGANRLCSAAAALWWRRMCRERCAERGLPHLFPDANLASFSPQTHND